MIEYVRNRFVTIFRRSVWFIRNSILCVPFDACLSFFFSCFLLDVFSIGVVVVGSLSSHFNNFSYCYSCQVKKSESVFLFVVRLLFVIVLCSKSVTITTPHRHPVCCLPLSIKTFLCLYICRDFIHFGQKACANNKPLAHFVVFHAYLMPLAVTIVLVLVCVVYFFFSRLPLFKM